jgi:ATP-binding cassette subfamily C protein CydD
VGPSGSGKSTLAELLLGFIQPSQGEIYVDDHTLESLEPTFWRSLISYVPQEPYLFEGTILENLLLARPDAPMEDIHEAAELAQAESFIQDLPFKYETRVGERGLRLSGGQIQRIALARAFLKDTPILILDEATANLDPENDDLIRKAAHELMRERSTLMIAHRLGTIYDAGRILVMLDGQIFESGTHEELVKRAGIYSRMVTAYRGSMTQVDSDTNGLSEGAQ